LSYSELNLAGSTLQQLRFSYYVSGFG
jgi:hypothetical protein